MYITTVLVKDGFFVSIPSLATKYSDLHIVKMNVIRVKESGYKANVA